ncbi:MAG: hypothetical protein NXI13_02530 [Proteobacteria bacterium]|nr:hypothetical protein [Pseudomonadota bacterium]
MDARTVKPNPTGDNYDKRYLGGDAENTGTRALEPARANSDAPPGQW